MSTAKVKIIEYAVEVEIEALRLRGAI